MRYDDGRVIVRVRSTQAFRQYMDFAGHTNASLAEKATERLRRQKSTATVGRAIVGHLRSGKRMTCNPQTARAIEDALGCPPGLLFVPKVAIGHMARGRQAVA